MSVKNLGVNVVGNVTGEYGLGESVRCNLRAFEAVQIPFAVYNHDVPWHRNLDSTYQSFTSSNPFPINLLNVNPDLGLYHKLGLNYLNDRYNIGFWAWELSAFNPHWNFAFDFFDEIWTPSSFCAETIAAVSPIPVFKVPHSLVLNQPTLDRQALNLPQDKFIFLFMFDFHSSLTRKNALATVEAFKLAFEKDYPDVLLILKFSNSHHYPEKREKLLTAVAGSPLIHLIDGHLAKEELHSLMHSCDCYVSLHRSEGFGLTLAEAMLCGKPVVATAYSANLDFMNVGNSFLTKYKLVASIETEGPYQEGCIWAEPDVEHAASLMRYVFEHPDEARRVGARAAQETQFMLSPKTIGGRVKDRLDYISHTIEQEGWQNRVQQLKIDVDHFVPEAGAMPTFSTRVFRGMGSKGKNRDREFIAKAWEKTAQRIEDELIQANRNLSSAERVGISSSDLSSQKYVLYCYRLLLCREPNFTEVAHWISRLQKEAISRKSLFEEFLNSVEYQSIYLDSTLYPQIDRMCVEKYIEYCYRLILGRDSDPAGKAYWLQRLQNQGLGVKELVSGFMTSDEYQESDLRVASVRQ